MGGATLYIETVADRAAPSLTDSGAAKPATGTAVVVV